MYKIPLLKDNHNHLFAYSAIADAIDIAYAKNKTEAIQIIEKNQNNKLTIVTRWFDNNVKIKKIDIDSLPPTIICNNSLHKFIINSKAEKIISKKYPEWVNNNDNQQWVEKNIMHIFAFIAQLSGADSKLINNKLNSFLATGVVFANDMYVTDNQAFDLLAKTNINNYTSIFTAPDFFSQLTHVRKKYCEGVKIFLDGALGAYSAALIHGYKNCQKGLLNYSNKELNEFMEYCLSLDTGLAIHCIGDMAIEQALQSIKIFRRKNISSIIRLEHAQFITQHQAGLAKDLGISLSMQPNFSDDSIIYSDRISAYYCKNNNPFRMLIDRFGFKPGKDLIFGSDGMPSGIEAAINQSLFPPFAGQKLTLEEFIAGYCCDNYNHGYVEIIIASKAKEIQTKVVVTKQIEIAEL